MNRKTIWTKWMSNNRPGKRRKLTSSHTTRRRRRIEFEFIQAWHHFPSTLLAFIFFSKLFLWSDFKLWEKLKKQARNSNLITDKGVKWEVSSAHLASSGTAMIPPTESKCRLFYSVQSRIFWSVNIIDVEIQRPTQPHGPCLSYQCRPFNKSEPPNCLYQIICQKYHHALWASRNIWKIKISPVRRFIINFISCSQIWSVHPSVSWQ